MTWGNVTGKLCTIGSGFLRAANPSGSNIPPRRIMGSAVIPIRFHPMDRVRKVWVRVADGLPYDFILGASFFRRNKSTLYFDGKLGFRPSPDAPWVPFVSNGDGVGAVKSSSGRVKEGLMPWELFCAVKPSTPSEDPTGRLAGESDLAAWNEV